MIANCPVMKGDIVCAEYIFCTKNRSLQDKTRSRVVTITEDLPTGMLEQLRSGSGFGCNVHQINPICSNNIIRYTFWHY